MFKGEAEIIPGYTNKLNAYLSKFFSKALVEKIAAGIYEKKEALAEPGSAKVLSHHLQLKRYPAIRQQNIY